MHCNTFTQVHLRYDTWGGFHYFRNVSKVHMVGTWDLDRDCAVTKDGLCCSVLQHVAVCCSVMQCVAIYCSVLQRAAVCCSVLQEVGTLDWIVIAPSQKSVRVAVWCSVVQCVAVRCSALQCVARGWHLGFRSCSCRRTR